MNNKTLNMRIRDNYSNILNKMNHEERLWAENFERMQYCIERGFTQEAIKYAELLKGQPISDSLVESIKEEKLVKERCNPTKAESFNKTRDKNKTGKRAPNKNLYDSSDWLRTGGTYVNDEGDETEIGVTVSPEDALVEAIDAARSHKVSLETYMNSPALWEQPRGKGRPKKLESV